MQRLAVRTRAGSHEKLTCPHRIKRSLAAGRTVLNQRRSKAGYAACGGDFKGGPGRTLHSEHITIALAPPDAIQRLRTTWGGERTHHCRCEHDANSHRQDRSPSFAEAVPVAAGAQRIV